MSVGAHRAHSTVVPDVVVVVAIFCFPLELRLGVSFVLVGVTSVSSIVGADLDPTSGNTVDRKDSAIFVPRLRRLYKVLRIVS